ncbi:hypothetical protein ACFU9F_09170 [Streptomyces zhihengii]|uniref:hypothetical protein n=1 Tax=Streptomyces zhihengii TaxID=1818004 RepID=UPI0036BB22F6
MSERTEPTGPEAPATESTGPEAQTAESTGPEAPGAPAARRGRTVVALVATAVGLALVAGAGAWGWSAVQDADRTAPTVVWAQPDESTDQAVEGLAPTGLHAQLLPMPTGYVPGPDVAEFGNDTVVDARRSVALLKESSRGLPTKERRRYDKEIDALRLKGLAMRSYRAMDGSLAVETTLAVMGNRGAGERFVASTKKMRDESGIFRKGPAIKGHREAVCVQLPLTDTTDMDMMMCWAQVGEVLVSVAGYGPEELPTRDIARLVAEQLDHIASPGEAV